jgi:hypothetical protein
MNLRQHGELTRAATGGPSLPRAPKEEKFFAREWEWDFISRPSGVTVGSLGLSNRKPMPIEPRMRQGDV